MTITNEMLMEEILNIKNKMATNVELEKLAIATAKGFAEVNRKIDNLDHKIDDVEENLTEEIERLAMATNNALGGKVSIYAGR